MTTTYAVYARVSSKQQAATDKVSIPQQLADCHAWAAEQGLTRAERSEYIDPGVSGETFEGRPAFVQLIKDGQAGLYDVVLVRYGDRISRTVKITSAFFHDLTKAGVQIRDLSTDTAPVIDPVEFKRQGYRDNDGALVNITFGSLRAELDQRQRVKRSVQGKRGAIERGKYIYTKPPFGYRFEIKQVSDTGKVERIPIPDPDTYHLLEELPALVLERHMGDRAIAGLWNSRGYTTRNGKPWSGTTIMELRSNPFYAGLQTYRRNRTTVTASGKRGQIKNRDESDVLYSAHPFERPWTREQFEAMAQRKQEGYLQGGRVASTHSPLVGLLRCGYCEATMRFREGTTRLKPAYNGKSYPVQEPDGFMCSRHFQTKSECQPNRWQAGVVWNEVAAFIDHLHEKIGEVTTPEQTGPELLNRVKSLESQIAAIRKELNESLKKRLQNVMAAFEDGVYSLQDYKERREALQERRSELEKQLTGLERELEQARNEAGATERITTALEVWQGLKDKAVGEQRTWDKQLVLDLKHKVLLPLFKAIYIKEPPAGATLGKWGRKENPFMEFEPR